VLLIQYQNLINNKKITNNMQEIIIEIRDAEGGEDSKLLVKDMLNIYLKWSNNNKVDSKVMESRDGFVSI